MPPVWATVARHHGGVVVMPTYDYKCPTCMTTQEEAHSMNESPSIVCKCGDIMKKVISLGGISFKGKGWTPKFGKGK